MGEVTQRMKPIRILLQEDSSNSMFTCIGLYHKWPFPIRQLQDRSMAQSISQLFKGLLLLVSPQEWYLGGQQGSQRGSFMSKLGNKLVVIVSQT